MEANKSEGSTQSDEGATKTESDNGIELSKRLEALEASNKRLLSESKDFKTKYQKAKEELEAREERTALDKGDLSKLLDTERKRKTELSQELEGMRGKVLEQAIRSTISKHAKDVHDVGDLLNQPDFMHILKEGIDSENLTVDEAKAKEFVKAVTEAKPWLKKAASQLGAVTTKPGNGVAGNAATKPLSQMTSAELEQALKTGRYS